MNDMEELTEYEEGTDEGRRKRRTSPVVIVIILIPIAMFLIMPFLLIVDWILTRA